MRKQLKKVTTWISIMALAIASISGVKKSEIKGEDSNTETEAPITTEKQTLEISSTTQGETTTEESTTIEAFTTTEILTTKMEPTTVEEPTTTKIQSTTVALTTTDVATVEAQTQVPEVVFIYNKGKEGEKTRVVTKGKKYGKLPSAQRKNYKFDGWYTQNVCDLSFENWVLFW